MAQELKDNEFHYTPEIARTKAKEAFNWRDYIQKYIDKYVDIAVKNAKFTTYVEIPKPERFDYTETISHVLYTARQLGWRCAPSLKYVMGYVYHTGINPKTLKTGLKTRSPTNERRAENIRLSR